VEASEAPEGSAPTSEASESTESAVAVIHTSEAVAETVAETPAETKPVAAEATTGTTGAATTAPAQPAQSLQALPRSRDYIVDLTPKVMFSKVILVMLWFFSFGGRFSQHFM